MGGTWARGAVRAFGSAEGFGAGATGGRDGAVYHVTNLNDSGAGSFRDAVSQPNRIVVFDVGGDINLASEVSVKSNITIAGQTAPGGGVQLTGHELSLGSQSNIIVRDIRVRPGDGSGSTENGISLYRSNNVILDHVSVEFANWNDIDAVDDNYTGSQITMQNSIIADPINQQFVAHTESLTGAWTWSDNLMTNAHNRNPLAKVDTIFKNNVVYNYGAGYTVGDTSGHFSHDLVNNDFITGPANPTGSNTFYQMNTNQSIYSSGNVLDNNVDGVLNGSSVTPGGVVALSSPWSPLTATLPTLTASQAYQYVIAHAGAGPAGSRDDLDSLVLSQVQTLGNGPTGTTAGTAGPDGGLYHHAYNTGLNNGGLGTIASSSRPAGFDSDNDGIPDSWETAHGLNPSNGSDAMLLNPVGYRMIEQYLNELADTDDVRTSSGASGDWNAGSNWAGGIVPSAMDDAQIRGSGAGGGGVGGDLSLSSGSATAMELSVGGTGPASGEILWVTGGKLSIYDTLTLGDQNNATLNLGGTGVLQAYNIILGNTVYSPGAVNYTGTLNMSGGTLQFSSLVLGAGAPGNWTAGGSLSWTGGTIQPLASFFANVPMTIGAGGGTVNTAGFSGDFAGVISGAGGITKTGSGTLLLSGANTNTGVTTISAGTLAINALSAGGSAGNLGASTADAGNLVLNGGTLAYAAPSGSAATLTDRSFTLTAKGGTLDGGSGGQWRWISNSDVAQSGTGNRTLTLTGSTLLNDFYLGLGDPAGGGKTSLLKTGSGRWILTAPTNPRSYSGDTTVSSGTLMTNSDNPLPFGAGKGNLVIAAGATFEMNGRNLAINALNGAGTVNQRGNVTRTLTLGNGDASGSFSGTISNVPSGNPGTLNLVKTGAGTQTLSGANLYTGTTTVSGGKLLLASNLVNGSGVSVQNGATLELAAGSGAMIDAPSVSAAGSGRIDVRDNAIITAGDIGTFSAGSYSGITGLIASGYAGGQWTGGGIVTTSASPGSNLTSLGVATAGQVLGISATQTATWRGQTVHGSDTLVMYTYGGDANLDGQINIDDYGLIDAHVGQSGSVFGWYNGDFNYDGKINIDDYGIIDGNIGRQGAPMIAGAAAELSVSAVPEPASLALIAFAGASLLARRRKT